MSDFVKNAPNAPKGYAAAEAAEIGRASCRERV